MTLIFHQILQSGLQLYQSVVALIMYFEVNFSLGLCFNIVNVNSSQILFEKDGNFVAWKVSVEIVAVSFVCV